FLPYIANAFGQAGKIVPYYAEGWTLAKGSKATTSPPPKPPDPIPVGLEPCGPAWKNVKLRLEQADVPADVMGQIASLACLGVVDGAVHFESETGARPDDATLDILGSEFDLEFGTNEEVNLEFHKGSEDDLPNFD
ncbi:MAG TPA: hypothetical protein VNA25_07110, partial [Phycisphaerae bacterium]|nr:hypothetical protein [Phycisphaerae bacterium]